MHAWVEQFFVESDFNSDLERITTCASLHLPNGNIDYDKTAVTTNEYPVDTIASFTCIYGFKRTGSASSTCQNSGTWSQHTPGCSQSN